MMRRMPLSFALMAVGIYIVVPTPDEILVHPFLGYMFSKAFNVNLQIGIMWSCTLYVSIGVMFLAGSIILGGRTIISELNNKLHSSTGIIIRGIDEKSGHVMRVVGDYAFSNTAEAEQVLTACIFDY